MRILMMISWIRRTILLCCCFLVINDINAVDVNVDQKLNILITDFNLLGLRKTDNVDLYESTLLSLRKDLEISGLFNFIDDNEDVGTAKKIRRNNVDILMTGFLEFTPESNDVSLVLRVFDIAMEKLAIKKVVHVHNNQCKRLGHVIADEIYTHFAGGEKFLNSNLIFFERQNIDNKTYKRLTLMDPNGENKKYLSPVMQNIHHPGLSNNYQYLSYVKFTGHGDAKVIVKNLLNKKEHIVGGGVYNASSPPRFSPDNNSIIYSLSQGPYTNVYEYNWKDNTNIKLTKMKGINTSPSYSPNGKSIIFSSDSLGGTHLFKMNMNTKKTTKITKKGFYTNPVWSPTGEYIVFTKMIKDKFYLGVIRPDGTDERLIAKDFILESPSWSSNGRYIVFSRQQYDDQEKIMRSKLHIIDVLNLNETEIGDNIDASSPHWSKARMI